MARDLYGKDVEDIETLERWLEQRAKEGLGNPPIAFTRDGNKIVVHFIGGDILNTPAMLVKAIQGTRLEMDHLKLGWSKRHSIPAGSASCRIVDPEYDDDSLL